MQKKVLTAQTEEITCTVLELKCSKAVKHAMYILVPVML